MINVSSVCWRWLPPSRLEIGVWAFPRTESMVYIGKHKECISNDLEGCCI
jgi:hypothetical protein